MLVSAALVPTPWHATRARAGAALPRAGSGSLVSRRAEANGGAASSESRGVEAWAGDRPGGRSSGAARRQCHRSPHPPRRAGAAASVVAAAIARPSASAHRPRTGPRLHPGDVGAECRRALRAVVSWRREGAAPGSGSIRAPAPCPAGHVPNADADLAAPPHAAPGPDLDRRVGRPARDRPEPSGHPTKQPPLERHPTAGGRRRRADRGRPGHAAPPPPA